MTNLYNLTCLDKSTGRTINVTCPADTMTKAYLETQRAFPNSDIISCKLTAKLICEDGWVNVFADYLIGYATVNDLEEFISRIGSEAMHEELITALWKRHHSRKVR